MFYRQESVRCTCCNKFFHRISTSITQTTYRYRKASLPNVEFCCRECTAAPVAESTRLSIGDDTLPYADTTVDPYSEKCVLYCFTMAIALKRNFAIQKEKYYAFQRKEHCNYTVQTGLDLTKIGPRVCLGVLSKSDLVHANQIQRRRKANPKIDLRSVVPISTCTTSKLS